MKRQNQLNIKRGLLSKLVLLVALFLGSSNVWGQAKKLPYSYGFENNDLASEGWTIVDGQSGSMTTGIASSNYAHNYSASDSKYVFRFYGNTNDAQYLVSPELEYSSTGIDVTLYWSALLTYGSGTRTFYVGYSTTTNEVKGENVFKWETATSGPVTTDKAWYEHKVSFPVGTKYIAIKYAANVHIYFDDFQIEAQEQYKAPKNLSIDSYTSNSATFTWTNGRDEEAWQIAYSTKEDFTPATEGAKVYFTDYDLSEGKYTIGGLVDGVTYYAYIRSYYGNKGDSPLDEEKFSNWSDNISFTTGISAANSGSGSSSYVPFTGASVSGTTNESQFIIQGSLLSSIGNRIITSLTFYTTNSSLATGGWGDATFEVYLKHTTNNIVNNGTYPYDLESDWGTLVYEAKALSVSNHQMTIVLDHPFPYTSGNLMVGFKQINSGTNNTCSWATYSGYGLGCATYSTGSISRTSATPNFTITSVAPTISVTLDNNGFTTFACPRPLDLTKTNLPSGLAAYKATLDAENGKVRFTEINDEVEANTGILLAGTAKGEYIIPFAESGSDISDSNAFLVNSTGGTFAPESGCTYFGFKKNSNPITFATFNPSTVAIPTNKAYLKVSTSGEARQLVAVFDDGETTGITEVRGLKSEGRGEFFNLNGQRVAQPTKGLYIVNGKKVLVP